FILHLVVGVAGGDVGEIFLQCTNVGVDAHAIVVEHNEHVRTRSASVIQGFEGHSSRHGAIADHGNGLAVLLSFQPAAHRHAQGRTDAGAAVAHTECVVFAFAAFWKSAEAFVYPIGMEDLPAAGKD